MTPPKEEPVRAAPKYRYFTAPPEIVRLKADDLAAFLPEGAWIGNGQDRQRELAVPAAEILETNYPRIRFARLCDLLPGCTRPVDDAPEWIALPADRVALAYRPETRRELLPEPVVPAEAPAITETPPAEKLPEGAVHAWKRVPKPVLAPAPEPEIEAPKEPPPFAEIPVAAAPDLRLGEVFGAKTALTIRELVAWCGAQPGIKACLLRQGNERVKSGDIADDFGSQGRVGEVLSALRKFSQASGLKLKSALTFHTESEPVSFLRHRGFVLVVLHERSGLDFESCAKFKSILQAIERAVPSRL